MGIISSITCTLFGMNCIAAPDIPDVSHESISEFLVKDAHVFQQLYLETRFQELEKILFSTPHSDQDARYFQALLLMAKGRIDEAIELLENITPNHTRHPNYHLGEIYYSRSNFQEAADHYSRYLTLANDSDPERTHIATHRRAVSLELVRLGSTPFPQVTLPSILPLDEGPLSKKRLVIQAEVDGNNPVVDFFIDSGAPETILDTAFAEKIGVQIHTENPLIATDLVGDEVSLSWGVLRHLRVGNLDFINIPVLVTDLSAVARVTEGVNPFGGVLSPQRLFREATYTVDAKNKRIMIRKKDTIEGLGLFDSASLYLLDGNTYMNARVNESDSVALLVDSGARSSKLHHGASRHLDIKSLKSRSWRNLLNISVGLGGFEFTDKLSEVTFRLGDTTFKKKDVTYIDHDKEDDYDPVGLIGMDFILTGLFIYDFEGFNFYFKTEKADSN